MKTIGIIGSRRRDNLGDYVKIKKKFFEIYKKGDTICSGGCPKGGDKFAELIAKDHNVPIKIHKAEWDKHGKGAGFIRNTYIANDSDVLIACVANDRKGGTEDTIRKFLSSEFEEIYLV